MHFSGTMQLQADEQSCCQAHHELVTFDETSARLKSKTSHPQIQALQGFSSVCAL